MTERLSTMDQRLVKQSRTAPIAAAHMAAAAVAGALGLKKSNPALWPSLGAGEESDAIIAVAGELASFVRFNAGGPAEALFIHARLSGFHDAPLNGWLEQPAWVRLAYSTFVDTLASIDAELERELAALPKGTVRPTPLNPEGTILETVGDVLDRVDFGPDPNAPAKKKGKA